LQGFFGLRFDSELVIKQSDLYFVEFAIVRIAKNKATLTSKTLNQSYKFSVYS
jgi:hypothetical protein